jgi:hypothetical protein
MPITLKRMLVQGPGREDAEVVFAPDHSLVRGPSDTGKSYIRSSLWYALGGDQLPKAFPQNEGYDRLVLEFEHEGDPYTIMRGLSGGSTAIYVSAYPPPAGAPALDDDVGELLIELSGAKGLLTLRSRSKRGAMTGGDLRHWFLQSQTDVISEKPTTGENFSDRPKHQAAFHVFLTGRDDSAYILGQSKAELERAAARVSVLEEMLANAKALIPPGAKRSDAEDSLARVDETLAVLTLQYNERAEKLRDLRTSITNKASALRTAEVQANNSASLIARFSMLASKYQSDLGRLGAIDEGVAYFDSMESIACPLCGAPGTLHRHGELTSGREPARQRAAVISEAKKIVSLRDDLAKALETEQARFAVQTRVAEGLRADLVQLQENERRTLRQGELEFSANPQELALKRGELSALLGAFEAMERLQGQIIEQKAKKRTKPAKLERHALDSAQHVASYAKELLDAWGLGVGTVDLDTDECDLKIDGRGRLTFGAGMRALFRAALTIAVLKHAMEEKHPHLGFVVIDSPLKSYADASARRAEDDPDAPLETVRDRFYEWLATWSGPGQVIILENEAVPEAIKGALNLTEFFGKGAEKGQRAGFFPALPKPSPPDPEPQTNGL